MRRFAVILGILAIVVITVLLSAPWWLGPALVRFGPKYGVTVTDYQRLGYTRFTAGMVEYRRQSVVVKVQQAEADTPMVWLWRRWTSTPGIVKGGEWSVEVSASERSTGPKTPRGWVLLQRRLERVADGLATWVPRVEAGKGIVKWPGGELTLASAKWQDRTVSSPDLGYRALHAAVSAVFPPEGAIEARAATVDGSTEVSVRSEGAAARGQGTWWGQPATLSAQFDEQGWLPREADLRANDWEVAGDRLKLGKHYTLVKGSGNIGWQERQLNAVVSVRGVPVENTPVPPLSIELRGHSNNDAFVAEALEISLPGIEAHLSAPVAIDRAGRLHSEPADFTLSADLAKQPWFRGSGRVQGSGKVRSGENGRAGVDFSVAGESISVAEIAVTAFKTDGQLDWPMLQLRNGTIATPDGSQLAWHGGLDFQSRSIVDAAASGQIARALLAPWLPEYPRFTTIQIEAKATGPWAQATHEGHAEVADFSLQKTNPLAITLDWNGRGIAVDEFSAEVRADDTALIAAGRADRTHVGLTALRFSNGENSRLELVKPAEFRWSPTLQLSPLELVGPKGSIRAALVSGETANAEIRAQHISSEWFRPFFVLPSTNLAVDALEADARWTDGPAIFSVRAGVTLHLGPDRAAQVSTELKGSADGIDLASLRVAEGGAAIVNAKGRLPVVIRPTAREKWNLDGDTPFTFDATTSANPDFWQELTQLTGVEIVDPEVNLHLDGTLNKPRGEVRVSATRLAPVEEKFKAVWPKIEALKLHATANDERIDLQEFAFSVEQQAVRVSGHLPLTFDDWRELTKSPREFAQRGEIRIEIPDAEIAAFDHYFPQYIAPKGRFQADLTFHGEKAVVGFIRLQDGTSRPLGPLGVLQEINADIRFNQRTATFQAVTARMGGQVVTLQGTAELPLDLPPQLDLTLKGENLPFVRRSGLLIRGDIDLQLVTPASNIPVIRGVVRLRDSLFLADVRSMIPSGAKGVAARPPYFSLETPPLNTWALDVRVEGERFLRLRTPVFNGTASARFRLNGTLGEPQIGGEAIINEGNIRLPFASFEVRQGELRLTAGQIEPQLWVAATTRRYGYDLRMELSGDASSPNIAFSSSPPLEAEQVLLMVMAGEAPSNEITTTDRQRVARFGAFFGQSLLGSLGGDPTGPDRLTISSGGDISEQGRETYSIEYKLADRWALTGEYDEFDDYYGGLKWRLFPKKERTSDEK